MALRSLKAGAALDEAAKPAHTRRALCFQATGFPSISISSDLDRLAWWARTFAHEQLPYAVKLALDATAADAAADVTKAQASAFDRPTAFTQRAWSVWRASKAKLEARVFAKDAQAKYLRWQVAGGDRAPNRRALRLPTAVQLDAHGNIPRGEIARLVQLAKAGKRLTKKRGAKLGVSSKVDLMYGEPGDGRPAGIYKRVGSGDQQRLVPLVVFPQRSARYTARLPIEAIVRGVVRARFAAHFRSAWAQARSTAR